MSRSYKKTPWSGDRKGKDKKRIANHRVRNWLKQHPEESLCGREYRKLYESWDICDYGRIMTWEQFWDSCVKNWYNWQCKFSYPFPEKEEEYRRWIRHFRAK